MTKKFKKKVPPSECRVCQRLSDLTSHRLVTIDDDKRVIAQLDAFALAKDIELISKRGLEAVYQCKHCGTKWNFMDSDGPTRGYFSKVS